MERYFTFWGGKWRSYLDNGQAWGKCCRQASRFYSTGAGGIWLRNSGWVHAMTDVSDGLATDLKHMIETKKMGAALDVSVLEAMSSVDQVLYDGEDFELLFTTSPDVEESMQKEWSKTFSEPLWKIGSVVTTTQEIQLDDEGTYRFYNGESIIFKQVSTLSFNSFIR